MFKKTLLASCLLGLAMPTLAVDLNKPISISVSAGSYDHKIKGLDSDDVTGFGIRAAYRAAPGFAGELGYFNYGEADIASKGYELTAIQAGIKGIYPISPIFEIYTRFGAAIWDLDNPIKDESGTDFYFGIGGEAFVREDIIVGVSYNQFTADADNFNYQIGGIEISIGYRF